MIGMSQIKKKVIQGIVIGVAIGAVGIGLTLWWSFHTIKTYENGTNKKYNERFTKSVVVANREIIQGEIITDDMLSVVKNININTIPNQSSTFTDKGAVVGNTAKYNIPAKVTLTTDMITDEIVSADIRSQEVNTVLMPSDLAQDEYVDIRIMYPNGTDYIVLQQKKIDKIIDQTFWLTLTEDERLLLNSAVVDSFLTQGTKLYATKYVDASSQTNLTNDAVEKAKGYVSEEIKKELTDLKSDDDEKVSNLILDLIIKYKSFASIATRVNENYQPNAQVMALMQTNSSILEAAVARLSAEARSVIENDIETYKTQNEENYGNVVSGATQSITTQQNQRTQLLNQSLEETTTTTEE